MRAFVGELDGTLVGELDGESEGAFVGVLDGASVGKSDGKFVGEPEGAVQTHDLGSFLAEKHNLCHTARRGSRWCG